MSKHDVKTHAIQLQNANWATLTMDGHCLSKKDSARVMLAYALWIRLMHDTSEQARVFLERNRDVVRGFDEAIQVLQNMPDIRMSDLCRSDVALEMGEFKAALLVLRHLRHGELSLRKSKTVIKRLQKQYEGSRKAVVWPCLMGFLTIVSITGEPDLFRLTNTLVQYLIRITLQDVTWIEEKAVQDYVEMENILHSQQYDPQVVSEVREVVKRWFRDWTTDFPSMVEKLQAEHGYGATAEVRRSEGTAAKYHSMVMTNEAYYLAKHFNWTPMDHIWPKLFNKGVINHSKYRRSMPYQSSYDLIGEVQFVPKGYNKKRTVSKEPTVNQFFQKKIGMVLSQYFDRHPWMHIDLHNQEYNRMLALKGSIDGSYATIDLSNASDSVTWTIVKDVFADIPDLLRLLQWARTTVVNIQGYGHVALEKFAPMGAGDCFPIECIVFSAVCAAVLKRHGVRADYRVYGDDIVVPSEYYDEVIELLRALHFQPNEDKSYGHGSLFTESCGIECYKGKDVSPIRLSRKWDHIAIVERQEAIDASKRAVKVLQKDYVEGIKYCLRNKNVKLLKYLRLSYKQRRRQERDRLLKKTSVGSTQLYSYYKLANDAYDYGYDRLHEALVSLTADVTAAPLWSNNHVYGFYTPYDVREIYSSFVYDGDTQSAYVEAAGLRVVTELGEDDLRYSKVLESLSTTHRDRLMMPNDVIDLACGAARTELRTVRVPVHVLEQEDSELKDSTIYLGGENYENKKSTQSLVTDYVSSWK